MPNRPSGQAQNQTMDTLALDNLPPTAHGSNNIVSPKCIGVDLLSVARADHVPNSTIVTLAGLLEIKPRQKGSGAASLHVGDVAKCVLVTCCSALSFHELKVPKPNIAVPFWLQLER